MGQLKNKMIRMFPDSDCDEWQDELLYLLEQKDAQADEEDTDSHRQLAEKPTIPF